MPRPADLAVFGDVYTVDAARSWTHAVAVRGEHIVALGEQAAELVGPKTRVIDAAGGLVVPGFQDAHVHVPFAGRNRNNLELNDLVGRPAYLEAIAKYAAARPEHEWIVGGGWALEHFPGGGPRKEDLDAVVGDRAGLPVQPRRARRLGQLGRPGPGRDRRGHAGPARRPFRARPEHRRADRDAPGRRGLHASRPATFPGRRRSSGRARS